MPDDSYPHVLIDSIDVNRLLLLAGRPIHQELVEYVLESLARLERADAEFALLAAVTPHLVFAQLRSTSPIPLLSIVRATCDFVPLRGGEPAAIGGRSRA